MSWPATTHEFNFIIDYELAEHVVAKISIGTIKPYDVFLHNYAADFLPARKYDNKYFCNS